MRKGGNWEKFYHELRTFGTLTNQHEQKRGTVNHGGVLSCRQLGDTRRRFGWQTLRRVLL